MANDLWTTVEEAVLNALEQELTGQVKTLVSYQGDWLHDLTQEYWRFPAVLVQLRQCQGEQVTLGSYDLTLEFTIFVVARGGSSLAAHARDDTMTARHSPSGTFAALAQNESVAGGSRPA